MLKSRAVATLGHSGLMLPVWVQAALSANDRLKLYLSVLQAAAQHAEHPQRAALDLSQEMHAAGLAAASWLHELPMGASRMHVQNKAVLLVPELDRLVSALGEELATMARPIVDVAQPDVALGERVQSWLAWLDALHGEQLDDEQLRRLTHGKREDGDSLHLLVMDLHKALHRLELAMASELYCGAHIWQLDAQDRPLVQAFMVGLQRTAMLKFDHPGLETAATRDGERLLLQNDIGTNDAHVLVVEVHASEVLLTYSDLHASRLRFFEDLLQELQPQWSQAHTSQDAQLNEAQDFYVASARFAATDPSRKAAVLEGIGESLVFLIDWNRARKRLLNFVDKEAAVALLLAAARNKIGHMAWLKAGGESLIHGAMQAMGPGAFRIGDRLDGVLGEVAARAFLLDVMRVATQTLLQGQPLAMVVDETRLRLARQVRRRGTEFDLLEDHAAYCQTLAEAVSSVLEQGHAGLVEMAPEVAARAKAWERRADHLVMQAREEAERQSRWTPIVHLLSVADDIADALEEAAFMLSLIADHHQKGWNTAVRQALARLARTVLQASQDHVRALAIARTLGEQSETLDHDEFLTATWGVFRAERQCDELLRQARRAIMESITDAPSLVLANDLAMTLELASDRLQTAAYALRDVVLSKAGSAA